ncbi:hypothetical protein L9F63_002039, partial [Diploptera punctata]
SLKKILGSSSITRTHFIKFKIAYKICGNYCFYIKPLNYFRLMNVISSERRIPPYLKDLCSCIVTSINNLIIHLCFLYIRSDNLPTVGPFATLLLILT